MTHRTPFVSRAVLFAASALAFTGCAPEAKKAAPPPPKIVVGHPVSRVLNDYGEYTGYLDAIQRIEIRPQVHGRIVSAPVPEGTEIKKGTLLFKIDDAEYVIARDRAVAALKQAEADVLRTNAEYDRAHANYERANRLYVNGKGAISEDEYIQAVAAEKTTSAAKDLAVAAVKQAEAALEQAKLNLGYTEIRAPIDGRVSRKLVTEGNLVGYNMQESHLTIMVDVDPIYVYFDVPERDILAYEARVKLQPALAPILGSIALGLPRPPTWSDAAIPLEVGVTTEAGYPHTGVINFRDPRFESGTGTLRLRGILDNGGRRLSSGMYARVRFPKGPPRERLAVPAESVISRGQEGKFIYLVEPPTPDDKDVPHPPEGFQVGVVRLSSPLVTGQEFDVEIDGPPGDEPTKMRYVTIEKVLKGNKKMGDKSPPAPVLTTASVVVVKGIQKSRPGAYVLYNFGPSPDKAR